MIITILHTRDNPGWSLMRAIKKNVKRDITLDMGVQDRPNDQEILSSIKYICRHCQETFEILVPPPEKAKKCPRCASRDVAESMGCSLEIGPPPWEYACPQCQGRFRIKSPSGPDEAKLVRCPRCESHNVKWLVSATQTCATGG
jgi:predicted Zn finger-like uncharacterized protein